jgi:CheY-like chemotaxis protein/HPt (histidine-containing phosphotransfer) domain-containing protein
MGGEMGFESRLGHGSVFWFTAPFTVAYTESATDVESVSPLPLLTDPVVESPEDTPSGYILVAEDYPPNQEVVKILLEEAGHRLDIVENGRLAVQAAAIRSYDLILMDLQMPEMDGLEATRLIRKSDGPCAGIPIVALTAHADQREEELCREAGMDGVIVKPIRFATFIKTVNESLPKKVKTTDSDVADCPIPGSDDAPGSADNADPISLDELTDAFGRNPGLAKSVLRDFVLQFRSQWTQIETAAKDGDLETLRRETHKIRGAAGNLTAWDLSDAATKVENAAKAGDAGTASLEFEVFEREYFRLCEYADRVLDAGSA